MITVHFYGRLAEELRPEQAFELPGGGLSISDLRQALAECFGAPMLREARIRVAVGDVFVSEQHMLVGGERVDFLAPLSGG